jgi:hypothetical protein
MTTRSLDADWEYLAALIPFYFRGKDSEPGYEAKYRRPIFMDRQASEGERQAFLHALLEISWLPPKVRTAVMSELGLSHQKQHAKVQHARAVVYRWNIEQDKARMKESGEKPREGIHEAAIMHEAQRLDMSVPALKQFLHRHAPTTKRRRTSRASAALAK